MILPVFKEKFKNLSTYLTTPEALISSFQKDSFTGFVHIVFEEQQEAIIFFEEGVASNLLKEEKNKRIKINLEDLKSLWEKQGIMTSYQAYPDEVYILKNLLMKKLAENGILESFVLGQKIVSLKNKKEKAIVEIESNSKKFAIYLWEGKIIWNLAEKEIFLKNQKIKARLYYGNELVNYKDELKNIEKTLKDAIDLYKRKQKKDFIEDFLFFIHETLANKYPIIDPFIGGYEIDNDKIKIFDPNDLEQFIPAFKKALKGFIINKFDTTDLEIKELIKKLK